jgi:hypothetical protein
MFEISNPPKVCRASSRNIHDEPMWLAQISRMRRIALRQGSREMTDVSNVLKHCDTRLRSRISTFGSERYANAVALWAKPVGPLPRAVIHCCTSKDVQLAIHAARNSGLSLSVRGGGHDWAGRALCDGIVIDLQEMRRVELSADHATALISGGARAMDVLAVTDPVGVVAAAGSSGAVGMAGLTLGGGYGALIGRFGLAADNLLAAEVVLADGRVVTADAKNESELLWSLRGGGGNFGVVTSMQVRLHSLRRVRSGMLAFPYSEVTTVLKGCADIMASAPEEMTVQIGLATGAAGSPMVLLVPTWCGSESDGASRLAPFLRIGTVLSDSIDDVSYGSSLRVFDSFIAMGQRTLMETCWIGAFDNRWIETFIEIMESAPPGCAIFTHEFKGAASRVAPQATAFGFRRDHILVELLASFVDESTLSEQRYQRWLHTSHRAFDAIAFPGGYPNLLPKGDTDRATASFHGNAERLVEAKKIYDPDNIFNSAIPLPAGRDCNPPSQLDTRGRSDSSKAI